MVKAKTDQMAALTAPLVNETGRVPGFVSGLITIIGGFFLAAVVWASLTGIKEFSVAPGTLSVTGSVQAVQNFEGRANPDVGALNGQSTGAEPSLLAMRESAAGLFLRQKILVALLAGQMPEFGRVGEEYPEQARVQKLRYSSHVAMADNLQSDHVQQDMKLSEELSQVTADLAEALQEIAKHEERVARLSTREETLIAEVQLKPADFPEVEVGAPVNLKVLAFDATQFGAVKGHVTSVSATASHNGRGEPYYLATISLERTYLGYADIRHRLLPGMVVQAEIMTGEKSLAGILFAPIFKALSVAFTGR